MLKLDKEPLIARLKFRSFCANWVVILLSVRLKVLLLAIVISDPDISPELSWRTVPLALPVKLPVSLNVQLSGAEEVADNFLFGSIVFCSTNAK